MNQFNMLDFANKVLAEQGKSIPQTNEPYGIAIIYNISSKMVETLKGAFTLYTTNRELALSSLLNYYFDVLNTKEKADFIVLMTRKYPELKDINELLEYKLFSTEFMTSIIISNLINQ